MEVEEHDRRRVSPCSELPHDALECEAKGGVVQGQRGGVADLDGCEGVSLVSLVASCALSRC